jgi:hypothetical protein
MFGLTMVQIEKCNNYECRKMQLNDTVVTFSVQEFVGSEFDCFVQIQNVNKINQTCTEIIDCGNMG